MTGKIGSYRDPDSDEETSIAPRVILPGVVPTRGGARAFVVDRVMPIPCRTATFVVWVEGEPYAGFENKGQAYDAVAAWKQRWPAAVGKNIHLVER